MSKTKYEPIYTYKEVGANKFRIVYAQYDFKSGLYNFKTQTMVNGCYSMEMPDVQYDTQKVLDYLRVSEEINK